MLQLTRDAAALILQVREHEGISDHAALRIDRGSGNHDSTALRLAFVDVIPAGDQVAESEGVAVCIAAPLVEELDDKILDVQETGGSVDLILRAA